MQDLSKIEVLAPAGDVESFKTAIYNGANAIYLGLGSFNARLKANNINKDNLRECVKFAHLFGVKVYLTVNTLVKDEELKDFIDLIKFAVGCKIDAFIVQDLGVAKLLKDNFENIVLHASTQMGIHNLKGALVAESLGFERIVVSRETKLEDIIAIKNNTNLEIEYFVQGALCVAFSGNCYFSSELAGKSGNRGECLQLCRMPYIAKLDGKEIKNGYLLSTSDLCLIKNLDILINAGICSFKIEGRLRRPGYVAQAVSSYRKALDYLGDIDLKKEVNNLLSVFNRGVFNSGNYLEKGVPDKIINSTYNNHVGIKIGKVLSVKPFKDLFEIIIDSDVEINKNDGLKFFKNDKEVASLGVGNVVFKNGKFIIYSKQKVSIGDIVCKTLDYDREQRLLDVKKLLPVSIEVVANQGEKLYIKASVVINNMVISEECFSDDICEVPQTKPLAVEDFENQIKKTGNTNFKISDIKVSTNNVFVSKSSINNVRRILFEKLEEKIIYEFEKDNNVTYAEKILASCDLNYIEKNNIYAISDINQLKGVRFNNKDIISICPENYSVEEVRDIHSKISSLYKVKIALNLPVVINFNDDLIVDNIIKSFKFDYLIVNNISGLYYVNEYKVIAGIGLNVFSNNLKNALLNLGVESCVKSIENISSKVENSYIYSYGNYPLMTLCHCPYKSIYGNTCQKCSYKKGLSYFDQKNREFKIRRYRISQCYFELLNNKTINKNKTLYNNYFDLRG